MQATIIGCGEAFDERFPNTSVLLRRRGASLLFDCGYSVPPAVWRTLAEPNDIDLIYISHAHADHYFGLPALLGRMWEEERRRPLTILSQQPVLDQIRALLEYGYRQLPSRFGYSVEYRPAQPGKPVEVNGMTFDFAPTQHSVTNLAVRVEANGKSFFYSGDGMFTDASRALCRGADLAVHEAYWFEQSAVHADINGLIELAQTEAVARLALVHVQRKLRRDPGRILSVLGKAGKCEVTMPDPGTTYEL
jgi:ribonuclease Z